MLNCHELEDDFRKLSQKVQSHELMRKPRPPSGQTKRIAIPRLGYGAIRISLEDIEKGIISSIHAPDTPSSIQSSLDSDIAREREDRRELIKSAIRPVQPYIKVTLRKSEIIVLFEQNSYTVLRDTEEGRLAEEDNKRYEYLTQGKGATRRRINAVTQTALVLYKTRSVNTESIRQGHVGSYVSNYEMFDTYKDLEQSTQSIDVDGQQKLQITTYKVRGVDKFVEINNNPNFELALMLMMRCLAGNVFEESQRRFRNMNMPDPLAIDLRYRYRLQLLWRYWPHTLNEFAGHSVADMSWCHCNGDILAVAYGIYSHSAEHAPQNGYVCIWNIKNPVNPERFYDYKVPVVSVEFSTLVPQLLAIGLYDGSVEIRDITYAVSNPVAISERKTSPSYEAMTSLKWITDGEIDEDAKSLVRQQALLALSQDGSVTKYRIINSPFLLGFQQIMLNRVEGNIEGLPVERSWDTMEAKRHPQGLALSLHPTQSDIFYILTDEGCFHKCSTNYPQEELMVWQTHDAAVTALEFSPWSPKLFLTCGNDWCIRIWMNGIFKPLITLSNEIGPIHCANWSTTHSTIIVAVNRKNIEVWDIRRSTLKPVSTYNIDESYNTMFKFSKCGRSIAVGNERGHVVLLSFEDMPFPPHFQYEELEAAIFKAITCDTELIEKVKSFGYFGYPDEKREKKKRQKKKKKKKTARN